MSHSCSTIVFTCIDFRFQKSIHAWLESQHLIGDHDRVGIAGGVLNITTPADEHNRALLLKQIEIAHNLHHIQKVILINHEDCGAYGGKGACEGDEQEYAKHESELKQAGEYIKQTFPDLAIETYFATLNGVVEKVD
ncbi:MAG: hypothetical protein A3H59_00610 [Candidatus Jacksonbacteria bacterium RIFCSPLOWO2_02_FULL_43_9]|nr:MAG: hypothetical protein UV70_C0004G0006 [Parcubacteria group bacterium GW2011_GWA2_43_13]OGY68631.1 MAG: hypothetical protein A3B94_00510 [Candidatus Jacksonbacteria bacterium RIFCSPHIGHO2_02_FULL_43_10]OGY70120.1 MAG: hypothetical protein A2986_03355 [Candidatus Jacksonbacteria bacterium RIFCSPLOWO2_01_FULL_44_13]OGY73900.1 MAG: hypothetical protein A3H59_00610 [Candidatus Jacksonbacteria bacterium RIFCSPLOWO2_02_FULL_43_9]HAZ16441.1 hypothetical protein [Candidatus Jacksonbacteria bacter